MGSNAFAQLLDTRDLDEARELIGGQYTDHRIRPASREGFRARLRAGQAGRLGMHRLDYGVGVSIEADSLENCVLISTPVRGHLSVAWPGASGEVAPGCILALDPERPFRLDWSAHCELLTLRLERSALTRALDAMGLESDGIEFRRPVVAGSGARRWRSVLFAVIGEAESSSGGEVGSFVSDRLEDWVAASVASIHGLRSAGEKARAPIRMTRHVRVAVAYLRAHSSDGEAISELSRATGVPARTLQAAFQRELGVTPSRYLMRLRLERARRALQAADSRDATVAAIAYAEGFGNLGRFAEQYRRRYGELPSVTLRRGAG